MKQIQNLVVNRVISEPGDMTRYDYVIFQLDDIYKIISYKSSFPFPQELNYFDIQHINNVNDCVEYIANRTGDVILQKVNPHTLLEVVNTIKELNNIHSG